MKWPDKHTCHTGARFVTAVGAWRTSPDGPFRTCDYCGSIHPEDLFAALQTHPTVRLDRADMKYGWPHKYYVEGIPNPRAGQRQQVGSNQKIVDGVLVAETPIMGHGAPTLFAKWYNDHLLDDGYDDEAWAALTKALAERGGHRFVIRDKRLMWGR